MRVGQRLAGSFLLVVSLVVAVGLVGLWAEGRIHAGFSRVVHGDAQELIALGEVGAAGARLQEWAFSRALETSLASQVTTAGASAPAGMDAYETVYEALNSWIAKCRALAANSGERAMMLKIEHASAPLYQAGREIIDLAQRSATPAERLRARSRMEQAEALFVKAVNEATDDETAELQKQDAAADRTMVTARFLTLAVIVSSIALALLLGMRLTSSMTRPLGQLVRGTAAIAQGDYAHRVDVRAQDEIGALAAAFNQMAGQLQASIEREKALAADAAMAVAKAEKARAEELRLVNQRLTRANEQLVGEMDDRRRAEATLAIKNRELERMNTFMIGREERVLELKRDINALLAELHRPAKYRV